MRNIAFIACILLLSGCGLESAGAAATVGKLQAEQAKQAKEDMEKIKRDIDAATNEAAQNRKKTEEAANN